ncbi:MAG: acetylornithine deacetylase [Gemmatimonadales bacterium]
MRLDDRALLARLVAFDTTSHASNIPLADFLAEYLDRTGVRIERNRSADGRKTNLVVAVGPDTEDRSGLLLSGHMDVVPALEADWRSDPFALVDDGDRYVGRGTADMKGFLALATNRLAALDPTRVRRPLALLFTYDEETGTLGARRFTETWPEPERLPREIVIGEPTAMRVVRAHKGLLRLRLRFAGIAAHSGYPHLGHNAIEPAARAIVALSELRRRMEAERPPHHEQFPGVPFAALNVGTIAGGSATNVVPDRCEVDVGIRLLPGMGAAAMADRIRETVADALGAEPFTLEHVNLTPPMIAPADAPIHRELCEAVHQHDEHSVMFATDAGWLQDAGFQCVLFGPGSIEVAHRANEFMPAGELRQAGELLDGLVHRRCLVE